MSKESLQMFLSVLKQDDALKEKLHKVKTEDEVMGVIKEAGFELDFDELKALREQEGVELTDDELDGVSGGNIFGDLCQNAYSLIFCQLSFCPHYQVDLITSDLFSKTYKRYCNHCNPPWEQKYTVSKSRHHR
ncbi:Nif11-like leader peptide family natural product precursor [Petroclostridium sp. X23]|uniref:Nif11-like leader peptide family natural product precursor n=1 Tax=Petroclostridium sp. X23 TaxID=3045146 RepID=UPI0024AD0F68|nr:Nif11-like leader peptide family natural product precursor [Petroclostridium sp. X23]WHH58785.1 Nif11-like leader peptide family natural product precursor [Petroclostridium sp. X23]